MNEALSYQIIGALFYISGAVYSKDEKIASILFTLLGCGYFIVSWIIKYKG